MSRHHRYAGQAKGAAWDAARKAVMDRDGHRCVQCAGVGRFEIHHRQPIHQGGGNDLDNIGDVVSRMSPREASPACEPHGVVTSGWPLRRALGCRALPIQAGKLFDWSTP